MLSKASSERIKKITRLNQEGRDVVKWRERPLFVYTAFLGFPPIVARAVSREVTLFSPALRLPTYAPHQFRLELSLLPPTFASLRFGTCAFHTLTFADTLTTAATPCHLAKARSPTRFTPPQAQCSATSDVLLDTPDRFVYGCLLS